MPGLFFRYGGLMRYAAVLLLAVFLIVAVLPTAAYAAIVNVTGYHYAHSNQIGKTNFKDNAGRSFLMGDFQQNDAVIKWIQFNTANIKGGTIFIRYDDGTTQTVSGDYVTLNKEAKKVEIVLSKTTYAESLVWIDSYGTMDDSNGGTSVQYNYQDPPVTYGSLGTGQAPGSDTGGNTGGNTGGGSTGGGTDTGGSTGGGSTGGNTGGGNTIGTGELDAKWNSDCSVVSWTGKPSGTTQYKVNINGSIKMTTAMSYTMPAGVGAGAVIDIRALDASQNELGKSVLSYTCQAPGGDTGSDTGGDTGGSDSGATCDVCSQIKSALECPGWDDLMGELTDAVAAAIPPPPNWDEVADKVGKATIGYLDDYMGDVPPPPTKQEVDQKTKAELPPLDLSTPTDDLKPEVPEEFKKGKIEFSLQPDKEIEVKDGSVEFKINDPVDQADPPGKKVRPGDPANSSGGIKHPDQVNTGAAPAPAADPSPTPSSPTPSTGSSSPGAVPSPTSGGSPSTGSGSPGAKPSGNK